MGTLMVIVCLSLMREAGRFETCYDLTISGQSSRVDASSRVDGTELDAEEENE